MKRIFIFLFLFAFLAASLPKASAFFTLSHEYWTLKGFEEINSALTQQCRPYLSQTVDGVIAADVPVLHYFDNQFNSYISTHTRGSGYQACLDETRGATDQDLRCMCVGIGLHIVQDTYSHTSIGLVPKYLKANVAPNLFGHMAIEHDFENKHIAYLKQIQDPIVISGELKSFDDHMLCTFFEKGSPNCPDAPGDPRYYQLLNEMSGIDMRNDLNLFHGGYTKSGFYDTVYNERIKLPLWFWGLSIGLIVVGLSLAIYAGITGKNKWKWAIVVEFLLLFATPGALILLAFFTNQTWQVVVGAMDGYLATGMLRVKDTDIVDYNTMAQDATNYFLQTGTLIYDDASGLTYMNRDGVRVEGALYSAEKGFMFGLFPAIILLFLVINIFLFTKAYELDWGLFKRKGNSGYIGRGR
jgi:hypothetical protein